MNRHNHACSNFPRSLSGLFKAHAPSLFISACPRVPALPNLFISKMAIGDANEVTLIIIKQI